MSDALGYTVWAFPGGNIPVESTGHEPEFTSRDELCILNTSADDAEVCLTVYFSDRDSIEGFRVSVAGGRVCHVWINDLIDPQAVPLGVPYGLVVKSSIPVIAQLTRLDTRQGALALATAAGVPMQWEKQ